MSYRLSRSLLSYQYSFLFSRSNALENLSIHLRPNRKFSLSSYSLRMRFVQFRSNGGPQRLGVQLSQEGDIIDVSAVDSSIPNNLVQFLESGPDLLEKAKR